MKPDDPDFARPNRTPRRRSPLRKLFFGACLLVGVTLVAIPWLISPSVVVPLVNQYGGLAPLKVQMDGIAIGWTSPLKIEGLQVLDEHGETLARVASVTTEKNLIDWASDYSDLKTIRIDGIESIITVSNGTSSIEEALAPLMESFSAPPDPGQEDTSDQTTLAGFIQITNSKLMVVESGRPEQWVVELDELSAVMPNADQVLGPINIKAKLADVSGTVANSMAQVDVQVKQVGANELHLALQMQDLPLEFYHLIHARLPEVPVDELEGRVTTSLSGSMHGTSEFSLNVKQLQVQNVVVNAPQLIGEAPAQLAIIDAAGGAAFDGSRLTVTGAQMRCDFANTVANANLPWPLPTIDVTHPLVIGANVDMRGTIDLARLNQAAQTLMPMRAETQLTAGELQFVVTHGNSTATGTLDAAAQINITGLQGTAKGQALSWKEPLVANIRVSQLPTGPQFTSSVNADFCELNGAGTLESGQVSGTVSLSKLQGKLNEWIELPFDSLDGSTSMKLSWAAEHETLRTHGQLKTSPIAIASTENRMHMEPAWEGSFSAVAKLADSSLESIGDVRLELNSESEHIKVNLLDTVLLAPQDNSVPSRLTLDMSTDLEKINRRASLFLTEPLQANVTGKLDLAVEGLVDLEHAEIQVANWRGEPITVSTPDMSFAEPVLIGSFKGNVSTNDLTQLAVENLVVQATSFSIEAHDDTDAVSGGRVGKAEFLVDLGRLIGNAQVAPVSPTLAETQNADATTYTASGRIDGQLNWHVNSIAAAAAMNANASDVVVATVNPVKGSEPLWNEPSASLALSGKWLAQDGSATIEKMQVQTPWLGYAGTATYAPGSENAETGATVAVDGQAIYDCEQLSIKLAPFTGDQLQLKGRPTVPVQMRWNAPTAPEASSLSGLNAVTQVGWDHANIAGVVLGNGKVPVTITKGVLASKTEIPVSQGVLRWDITSDLTSDDLVIHQQPMRVLENVAITPEMCNSWLRYVNPLISQAATVEGLLSLQLDEAAFVLSDLNKQTIAGQLQIHGAQIGPGPVSNTLIQMVNTVDSLRKRQTAQTVSSKKIWLDMVQQEIDFRMQNGEVTHENLSVKVGDATINTSGSVSLDGQMKLLTSLPIPDDWADKSKWLVGLRGQALSFPLNGSFTSPQLDTSSLQQVSTAAVGRAADTVIKQGITKGLDKIFGEGGTIPGLFPNGESGSTPSIFPQLK